MQRIATKEQRTQLMAKKKKMPKYQFGVGRRTIHIEARDLKSAQKKAEQWRDKNAKNSVLAYDFRVD
jgi:hypothetical protein